MSSSSTSTQNQTQKALSIVHEDSTQQAALSASKSGSVDTSEQSLQPNDALDDSEISAAHLYLQKNSPSSR